MTARYLICLLCLLLAHSLRAQRGDYYLVHHAPPDGTIDNINFSITQDQNGFMWMANRKGLVRYDGQSWEMISTRAAMFQVISTPQGVYGGGRGIIGKVSKSGFSYSFDPLIEADTIDDVFHVLSNNHFVWFISEHHLHILDSQTDSIRTIYRPDLTFIDAFAGPDGVVLSTDDEYYLSTSSNPALQPFSQFPQNLIDVTDGEGGSVALHASGFLLDLATGDTLQMNEPEYLLASNPIGITWITENLLAISSLSGGVMIVDKRNGTTEIVNYYNGLPENQVYAMKTDADHALWVAHDYGFTRIMPLLPIRDYSKIAGIEGNILSISNHNGTVYAASTVGLFALVNKPVYEQKVTYRQVFSDTEEEVPVQTKKGLFGFLKKKKNQPRETETRTRRTSRTVKEIKRELVENRYSFSRIGGVIEETHQLISTRYGLLAGGLSGIHVIQDTTVNTITGTPIRTMHYSARNSVLTASTYSNEMLTFVRSGDRWESTDMLEGLEDFVYHITESSENLWLSGADSIYRIQLQRGSLMDVDVYPLTNPYFMETYAVEDKGRMVFINESSILVFDESTRTMRIDSALMQTIGIPKRIFLSADGSVWIYNGTKWSVLGGSIASGGMEYLLPFPNLRQLEYTAEDSSFWLVTHENKVLNIKTGTGSFQTRFSVQLTDAINNDTPINTSQFFEINQDDNNLIFRFIQPEYSGIVGVQYRYRLRGLNSQWTSWAKSNNHINYSYLPPGKYTLELETQNNFQHVSSYPGISFEVVPPYWRQPWFYALEVVLFSTLLIVSIRMNRKGGRYGIMSRLLAFLTLILIVEFVQTVAEYKFETDDSPVIDFFIQVSIALLVLPVESLLRKAIFKKSENEKT